MEKVPKKFALVKWKELPWTSMRRGADSKSIIGERATLQLNRLQPGSALRIHSHPFEQFTYILSGRMEFHIEEDIVSVAAESCMLIAPNVTHYGVVQDGKELIALDVFVPRKEDNSLYTELTLEEFEKRYKTKK